MSDLMRQFLSVSESDDIERVSSTSGKLGVQ